MEDDPAEAIRANSTSSLSPAIGTGPIEKPGTEGFPRPHHAFAKSVGALAGASTLSQLLALVQGFLARRLLGPELIGIWSLAQLVMTYAGKVTSGIMQGSERAIPLLLGGKREAEARWVIAQLLTVILLEGSVVGAGIVVYVLIHYGPSRDPLTIALLAVGVLTVIQRLSDAFVVAYRGLQQFVLLSQKQVISATLTLVLVVGGAWLWGFYGFIGGSVVALISRLLALEGGRRSAGLFPMYLSLDKERVKRILAIGFPVSLGDHVWGVFVTLDSLLVASFLGTTPLAFYALAANLVRQASEIPTHVSTVLTPRLLVTLGDSRQPHSLASDMDRFLVLQITVIVPVVALAGFFGGTFLVRQVIPSFGDAIVPLRLLMLGLFFIPQTYALNNVLIATGRTGVYIGILGIGVIAVAVFASAFFFLLGRSLLGVAVGTVLGYAVYYLLVLWRSGREVFARSRLLMHALLTCSSAIYTGAVLFTVAHFLEGQRGRGFLLDVLVTGVACAIGLAAVSPWVWYGNRVAGLHLQGRLLEILVSSQRRGARR